MTSRFSVDHLLDKESLTGSVPFDLSPDGGLLTFSLTAKRRERPLAKGSRYTERGVPIGMTGSQVAVLNTRTHEAKRPFRDYLSSWGGTFSPDGRYLAAYVEGEQSLRLGLWDAETDRVRVFSDVSLSVSYWGFEVVRWTRDSKRIVCKLVSKAAAEKGSKDEGLCTNAPLVEVFSNPEPPTPDGTEGIGNVNFEGFLGDLGTVDVEGGTVRRLLGSCPFTVYQVAPDGHAVALLRVCRIERPREQIYAELVTVPFDGASAKVLHPRVATDSCGSRFSWSPDSRWICFIDSEKGQSRKLRLVPTRPGSSAEGALCTDLTPEGFARVDYDDPVWSGAGEAVFTVGGGALWRVPTDGRAGEKLIEEGVLFVTRSSDLVGEDRGIHAVLVGRKGEGGSLVRVPADESDPETVCRLRFRPTGCRFYHSTSPDGSTFCLAGRSEDNRIGIHTLGADFSEKRPPHRIGTEMDRVEPAKRQIIHYQDTKGNPRKAELFLPPDHQPDAPCPLVVVVYGGQEVGTQPTSCDLYELLCAARVGVLKPEMPLEFGNPMPQLPEQVIPALDHVIEMGVADPGRIGVYGQSYGGYCALALLVQMDRFRAAVLGAPLCNLTSSYAVSPNWHEKGQGRLGCAPWEDPNVYVKNSPLFFMDKIDAPILVISIGEFEHGKNQDMEVFRALQRLDKRVELRRYARGGHGLDSLGPLDLSDCYTRILEWYMEHLVK